MTVSPDRRRFLHQIGHTPPPPGVDGLCWIWTGARNPAGTPRWWHEGRTRFPHVWAWEADNGPKPAGMMLSPRCGRPYCVRPSHRVLRRRGSHPRRAA